MKVLALRADKGGCAFYRIEEPARVVSEQFGVEVRVDTNVNVEATKDEATGLYDVQEVHEDIDLLIVQRPLNNSLYGVIKQAKKQGIATIVEIDDDFENVHPRNAAYRQMQPSIYPHSNYEWVHRAAQEADLVTVSTPALSRYAGPGGKFAILPNKVPASLLDFSKSKEAIDQVTVGWSGTIQTHPEDLEVAGDAIARALAKHKTAFMNVGDGEGVAEALDLRTPLHFTQWVPLSQYHQTLINLISIGVVPLKSSKFNDAKSALKGIEMAALGIPFIASPTPEYVNLANQGIGLIASSPDEWYAGLNKWLKNPRKAYLDGQRYRRLIGQHHTYEGSARAWHDAWQQALDIRAAAM